MVSKTRLQRISERVREELSEMLLQEVSDPRLEGIYVTDVHIDRELAFATIYISALEGSNRWEEIREGLEHAKGYLRHELSQRIELRTFPQLRFQWDSTYERAEKIERLFKELEEERTHKEQSGRPTDGLEEQGQDGDE